MAYLRKWYSVLTVIKKLTRTGNSIAVVLAKPLLEELGLDEGAEVEVSTNGQIIVIAPKRTTARDRKFRKAAEKINRKYAGLFKRLSE
jgi:antitoxin component of MazEF toxin-antitoxin module